MEEELIKHEAEFEFYSFSLKQFKLENRLITKVTLKNCVETFKNKLIEKLKETKSSPETIKKLQDYAIDDLCFKLYTKMEPQFKEFDELVDQRLTLSDNLVYHYGETTGKYTEENEKLLENEIEELELWFKQNKVMLAAMEAELEIYKNLEPIFQKENQLVEKLDQAFEKFNVDFNQNEDLLEKVNNISQIDRRKSNGTKSVDSEECVET